MGGSPKPPPPPPDYTEEKASFSQSEAARRQQEAKAYNAAVTAFNNSVRDQIGKIGNFENRVNALTLRDDEQFQGILGGLTGLGSSIAGMNFNMARPTWESTVQSAWGPVSVDVPELLNPDFGLRDAQSSRLGTLSSKIGDLQSRRRAEENRIDESARSLYGSLSGILSQAGSANISDIDFLNNLRSQGDALRAQREGFSSEILGDYNSSAMGLINPAFASLNSRLNSLFDQRSAEEKRVRDYEQGLVSRANQFRDQYNGLTIASEGGINSLQNAIDTLQSQAGLFNTPIRQGQYDFSQELGDIQGIEDLLGQLRNKRTTELDRVKQFQDQYGTAALGLASQSRLTDMFSGSQLEDIMARVEAARAQRQGFSSLLATDFNFGDSQLDAAEATIESLMAQRANALSQIDTSLASSGSRIDGLTAYDEFGMNSALQGLNSINSQLSRFTGSDVTGRQLDVANRLQSLNTRLQDLFSQRSQLEQRARTLLNTVKNASYTSQGQIGTDRESLTSLQDEVELYNAQQALDEINSIVERLNAEKSRLETDANNVARAQQNEQLNPTGTQQGTSSLQDIMSRITPEQYEQLLALSRRAADGDQAAAAQYSAFIQSLGLGA